MNFIKKISPIFPFLFFTLFLFTCGETPVAKETKAKPASTIATKPAVASNKTATTTPSKVMVKGENISTTSGGEFCVDVQVANFVDIISMQYSTNWDNKMLQYNGVKNFVLKDLNKQSFGQAPKEPGTLRISWYPLDLQGVTLFDNATIYQVCFKAIGKSGSKTQVDFSNQPMVAEFANSKMQKLGVDLKSVEVTIK